MTGWRCNTPRDVRLCDVSHDVASRRPRRHRHHHQPPSDDGQLGAPPSCRRWSPTDARWTVTTSREAFDRLKCMNGVAQPCPGWPPCHVVISAPASSIWNGNVHCHKTVSKNSVYRWLFRWQSQAKVYQELALTKTCVILKTIYNDRQWYIRVRQTQFTVDMRSSKLQNNPTPTDRVWLKNIVPSSENVNPPVIS